MARTGQGIHELRFAIKQGNSDQHAGCKIKARCPSDVQNYQMNNRSVWVYMFFFLNVPLKGTEVMGCIKQTTHFVSIEYVKMKAIKEDIFIV